MPRRLLSSRALAWIALAAIALAACDSIYYKTMKKFGWEKRDILVKKVVEARGAQADAQKEIKTTLERFKEIVDVDGGSLEDKYNKLNDALQRSEERAKKVDDRIKAVRDVSSDLFKEWQNELGKYSDRRMRQESERELRATKARTETLIQAMARAQQRVEPVLEALARSGAVPQAQSQRAGDGRAVEGARQCHHRGRCADRRPPEISGRSRRLPG